MSLPHVDPPSGESVSPHHAILWRAGRLTFALSDLVRIATDLGWFDDDARWIMRCDQRRDSEPPDDLSIQQASEDFRYAYDLLTAEEIERWLAARDLSLDDFQLHCERMAVAASLDGDEPVADSAGAAAEAGLDAESWRIHLWLSGTLPAIARRFAWLLIAAHEESGQAGPDILPDVATWRSWETLAGHQRSRLLAGPKAARVLEAQRWPLTRVSVEATEFADEGMAREAELCLRERSATMEEIVAGTGAAQTRHDCLVQNLPEDWQSHLVTLPAGAMRLLIAPDAPPRLMRVLARTDPTLDDHDVRETIARRLQEDLLGSAERELISWEHPLLRMT